MMGGETRRLHSQFVLLRLTSNPRDCLRALPTVNNAVRIATHSLHRKFIAALKVLRTQTLWFPQSL
jgi:hypothetical protein